MFRVYGEVQRVSCLMFGFGVLKSCRSGVDGWQCRGCRILGGALSCGFRAKHIGLIGFRDESLIFSEVAVVLDCTGCTLNPKPCTAKDRPCFAAGTRILQ